MKPTLTHAPLAPLLNALGEQIRLRILRLLEREELSVGEVADVVQLAQSTVSRQLKTLGQSGWLVRRAEGPATMYRLMLDNLPPPARAVWVALRDHLGRSAEFAEDIRRLESVLAGRMTDSQSFFGRVSGEWDDLRNELFGVGFTAKALLGFLDPSWTVIDAGCGTGNASELLSPFVARVIAVDESASMLSAAKKRLTGRRNVEFVKGSLERLPVASGTADAVVCVLVLHHLAEPGPALEEMRRVLKPGGAALVVDMLRHDREEYRRSMGHKHLGFDESEIALAMESVSFADIRVGALPGETHAKGPSLFVASGKAKDTAKTKRKRTKRT